ncbi:MAG TPA: OPT/YSL family transporter [Phycisphaerales bacterium]|nr:OPT/YSL family transporter [Phycisphaerales bacterium]
MAIPQLTQEQIDTWSRRQKDEWWLTNVFRGNMPQLTLRSAITGFLLGGVLSATNLYVGAKTGWTLGVGLTSVILAFAAFRVMSRIGARDMTILENNASQSIATAAGYMTGPLISGMAAYMWIQNKPLPWYQMFWFNVVLSVLGVLVAFPMKRRFINDEQQPFPEGRACGVVLDTLYTSQAAVGMFKAKALAVAAAIAGFVAFVSGEAYFRAIHLLYLMAKTGNGWSQVYTANKAKLDATWHLPHDIGWFYTWLASKNAEPRIAGVSFRQLGVTPTLDLAMFGAGGLMGIKAGISMMIGMVINFFIIVPWMITIGEIQPKSGSLAAGDAVFGRVHILNNWALWWGISMMITAAMVSLFAKPQVFVEAFKGLFSRKTGEQAADPVKHIEVPLWISWVGMPVVGAVGVWMAHEWFGVSWILGALAIPMIIILTLIAASSTALTGITPTGSLSKIPQFIFGAAAPKHPATNLMTGVMCVEVASNASNLLMDIKPGYMLGGKPRHQAVGHIIGIVAGSLAATPLFFLLFLKGYDPAAAAVDPNHLQAVMTPEEGQFGFPSAIQWKGVSDLIASVFGGGSAKSILTTSIITSMIIAAIVSLAFEIARIRSKGKFPLSPLAIGLGVVVPPDSTLAMFAGALFFWAAHKIYHDRKESLGNRLWIQTHEPICAGIIAGAALVGIGDVLVKTFGGFK